MRIRALLLALAAAAPVLPLPAGLPVLLILAVEVAVGWRALAFAMRIWTTGGKLGMAVSARHWARELAVALLLFAAVACLTVAAVRSWRLGAGQVLESQRLASRYVRLWEELREPAVELRAALPPLAGRAPGELFAGLRKAIREAGPEITALLFDSGGGAVAWSGPGLLHELTGPLSMTPGPTWRQGLTAATLLWVEEIPAADGIWRLVTGRSVATDRLPGQLTPGGELPAAWTLAPAGAGPPRGDLIAIEGDGLPTLLVEPPAGEALSAVRRSREAPWRRGAAALVAVALAVASSGRSGPRLRHPAEAVLLAAALFSGVWSVGAAWPAALAVGAAAVVLLFVLRGARRAQGFGPESEDALGDELSSPTTSGWRRWLPTSALALMRVGALVAAYRLVSRESAPVSEVAWAGSLSLLAAAAILLVGRKMRRSSRMAYVSLAVATVALAFGGGVAASPWLRLAALIAAVAAVGVWLGAWSLPRDWGRMLGAAVLAAVAGGQLCALAAGRIRERDAGSTQVPSTAELEQERRSLERRFRRVSLPPWTIPDSEHGQIQDVALALWRQSPLARRGVLSALTVERAGRPVSSFAFGLPMTDSDRLDPNPNRWQELRLPGWDDTLIEGEGTLEGLGTGVRLWYWALLRPGFRTGDPLTPDLAAGLVRGPPDAGRMQAAAGRFAAATEGAELRPRPWSAFLRQVEPRLARQDLGWGLGLTGRVLVAAAGASVVLLLLTMPAARIRQILERAWSSYSQRLVAVFALLVLATLIPLQTVLVGMMSRRMDAEQLQHGTAALESTQRVLGEYVDSLAPGFGVQTALDDELLSWLARVIHHEVNLYWDSSVYASSRRELFTAGLLPVRIPGEIYADLALAGAPVSFRRNRVGETSYLEIYAPLRVPGLPSQERLFLSIPLLAQQEAVAAEVETLRRRTLLTAGALFLILLAVGTTLARSFSGPLRAMADGTRRIAGGAERLQLKPGFRELATLAEAIDDMAHRIGEGRRRLLGEKQLVDRVVDSVTSAVVSLDGRGRVLLCNARARELLAIEPGGDLKRVLSGRQEMRPVLEALEAAPEAPLVRTVRLPPAGADADEREWTIVVTPLPHGDEPSTLLVVEDITEVLRGQRLQAWAEMARIIAHEIKNPLTPIRLSAEHLREVYEADPQGVGRVLERCTDNILRQVEELRQIAGEFATFSQIPRLERQDADLIDLVRETVAAYLVRSFGHVPNGNRAYYLSRSQPPFLAAMVDLYAQATDTREALRYLDVLEAEHAFWMDGADRLAPGEAHRRVVRLADGSLLNRYWDDQPRPRPESYREDHELASTLPQESRQAFYRNVRAAAESGWDFSSRWMRDPSDLRTLETVELVPVDLNSLLYHAERTIAALRQAHGREGDAEAAQRFTAAAERRRRALLAAAYDPATGFFYDVRWRTGERATDRPTLAAAAPLYFGLATPEQGRSVAARLERDFLEPGGFVTTARRTGQQWDAPNGWPPLQWLAIQGARRYGRADLAQEARDRWLALNRRTYRETGRMVEKYDVVDLDRPAGGGEYPTQDGFGWTNGVALALAADLEPVGQR